MSILRILILAVALYGYMQFFSKKIKPEFALGFIFASIGSIMFFAGILNILPLAAYTITAVGCALAVLSVKDFKNSVLRIITPGTVFFAVLSVFFAISFRGDLFTGSDVYHHWGTVVNTLVKYNRFPTADNFNIVFPSYPTGSAAFIYFFAKILNIHSEGFIVLMQTILTLGMFISVFAFAKGKVKNLITCAVVVALLCTNEPFHYLVVDNLLSAVTVAGMAVAVYHRDELSDKFLYLLPFTVFLTAIKNSGVLFACFIAFYCFIYIAKNKQGITKSIGLMLAPFVTLILWQKHVDLLFPSNRDEAHHAMSVGHYKAMYQEKVASNIVGQTWNMYSEHVFTLNNVFIVVAVLIVLCIVCDYAVHKKPNRNFIHISVFSIAIYVVYQIGLLGMYLFSMPVYEMSNPDFLPSYDRYHLTIIVVVSALVYIGILHYLDNKNSNTSFVRFVYPAILLLSLVSVNLSCNPHYGYLKPQAESDVRWFVEYRTFLEECNIPQKHSYLLINDQDGGFIHYATSYILDPTYCKVWSANTLKNNLDQLKDFDYIIVYDNSTETVETLSEILGVEINERALHLDSLV